jgi:hypothetical protein
MENASAEKAGFFREIRPPKIFSPAAYHLCMLFVSPGEGIIIFTESQRHDKNILFKQRKLDQF